MNARAAGVAASSAARRYAAAASGTRLPPLGAGRVGAGMGGMDTRGKAAKPQPLLPSVQQHVPACTGAAMGRLRGGVFPPTLPAPPTPTRVVQLVQGAGQLQVRLKIRGPGGSGGPQLSGPRLPGRHVAAGRLHWARGGLSWQLLMHALVFTKYQGDRRMRAKLTGAAAASTATAATSAAAASQPGAAARCRLIPGAWSV